MEKSHHSPAAGGRSLKIHSIATVETGERRLDVIEFIAVARALGFEEGELLQTLTSGLPKILDI